MEGTCLEAAETVQSYQPTHQPINHIVSSPNTRQTLLPLQICGHTVTRVNPHVIARVAAAVGEVTTLKPWNIALLLCRPHSFLESGSVGVATMRIVGGGMQWHCYGRIPPTGSWREHAVDMTCACLEARSI